VPNLTNRLSLSLEIDAMRQIEAARDTTFNALNPDTQAAYEARLMQRMQVDQWVQNVAHIRNMIRGIPKPERRSKD
jgi:hypothetical protein